VLLSYNAHNDRDVNIAAGRLATGYVSSQGIRFGSDNFFSGGSGEFLGGTRPPSPQDLVGTTTLVQGTADPFLYTCLRRGSFSYNVPLPNGSYEVTLGFAEPDSSMAAGDRSFNVSANGETRLANFDVLQAAGGRPRAAVTRSFPIVVSSGSLRLDFKPVKGEAVVSNIMIRSR
jgi:beta-galactosidase